jgi:hypothetical protein
MNRIPVLFFALSLGLVSGAQALTGASSIKVKVFEMRASANSDCSNPVAIFKTDNPTPVDLMTNPVLGSGALPNGTYQCLMFHISDILTVVPQSDDGTSCKANMEYPLDIFTDLHENLSATPEGVTILAHPGVEDDPWIYLSNSSVANTTNDCFSKTHDNCALCSGPCKMNPIVEMSDQTHSLVINVNSKVDGSGIACVMQRPVMSIR